jgi:hypothetical protein
MKPDCSAHVEYLLRTRNRRKDLIEESRVVEFLSPLNHILIS